MASIPRTKDPVSESTADIGVVQRRIRSGRRQGHYYVALLGFRTYDPMKIYERVQRGFSYSAFEHFQRNASLSALALAELTQIPARTLARRKEQGRLGPEESDRLVRFARVFARALELFEGTTDSARAWLSAPQRALGGATPLALAATDVGANEVQNLIGRLEHGIPT